MDRRRATRSPSPIAITRLGRHPDSEIMLDDITVSRRHAEVGAATAATTSSATSGSLNGTYVNQERIDEPTVLHHGDELQVGKFRLVFFEREDGHCPEATVASG